MSVILPAASLPRAKPAIQPMRSWLMPLASLRLTVILLGMSVFLVFVGTLAQIDGGIWTIVSQYFRSWIVMVPFKLFSQLGQKFQVFPESLVFPGYLPFPGGWTIGMLLMANLVAAHAVRFRLQLKRAGVLMLHAGLIILMLGEFITGIFQVEAKMTIGPNESVNFVENSRNVELAIIDRTDSNQDIEYTIPESMLRHNKSIKAAELPFDVDVLEYMNNSELDAATSKSPPEETVTSKTGSTYRIAAIPESSGVDTNAGESAPAVRFRLKRKGTDDVLMARSISLWCTPNFVNRDIRFQFLPITMQHEGKRWLIEMRGRREYLPFALTLRKFRFDRYPGTNTPKNFSSLVSLSDPRTNARRDVLIRMNEPLAYDGATYYQSGYTRDEKGTVLQVTRNPGVWLPYISCTMIVLGMVIHFGQNLIQFLGRTVRT